MSRARELVEASSKTVVVNISKPDAELSDYELIERIKSYGKDAQSSFGLFVRARGLKPGMDMKDFKKIWDSVVANPHKKAKKVKFRATHKSKHVEGMEIMVVTRTPTMINWVANYGGTGGDLSSMFDDMYQELKK